MVSHDSPARTAINLISGGVLLHTPLTASWARRQALNVGLNPGALPWPSFLRYKPALLWSLNLGHVIGPETGDIQEFDWWL